ncbi:KGGVGR-motif variant AAA ATPase [Chryseobacterium gambrini]|uniref:KGGVGR-motif variant AAA ATPase n=1 Tax=Chryseobacterium gambrini TaxID=373672 RepID=UPI003D12E9B0
MKTITFYSYKGGVGRSLALVNIATRLSEFGKKVCVLDFDLEAPGLHLKFPVNRHILERNYLGIVDFVYKFANEGLLDDDIKKYSINIKMSDSNFTLIPAGNTNSANYWKKLSAINWHDLIYENPNGLSFFLKIKELIEEQINPDFLLIDSRTGISETSGLSLSVLADEVVILAANNKENLSGVSKIIESLSNVKNTILEDLPKLKFVLSRIPFTDKPSDKTKEYNLINRIKREYLFPYIDEVYVIHSDRELEEFERVKIAYEKDDSSTQISIDYLKLFESLTVNDLSDKEIEKFKNIRKSERFLVLANNAENDIKKLEYINKAIELNISNADLFLYRALLHYNLDDNDAALKDLEIVLNKNKMNYEAIVFKIDILINQKLFAQANSIINRYLDIFKNDFYLLTKKVAILYFNKKYLEADEIATKMIELNPESSNAYSHRGNIRRVMKKFSDALNDVFKAYELDPNNVQAIATLGEIYAETGRISEFMIQFENAVKMNKNYMQEALRIEEIYREFRYDERFNSILARHGLYIPDNIEYI